MDKNVKDVTVPDQEVVSVPPADKPAPTVESEKERKFTQADVDRYLGEMRREEKKVVEKGLLEKLGSESVADLETLVTAFRTQEEAKKSESDKLNDQLATALAEKETLKAQIEAEKVSLAKERLERLVLDAVRESGAKKPEKVVTLLQSGEDFDKLVNEDGEVISAALKKLVDTYKSENPEDFASTSPGVPSNAGAKPPGTKLTRKEVLGDITQKLKF